MASNETYENALLGIDSNTQNYLDQLASISKNVDGYAAQMSSQINSASPSVSTAANSTFEGKYKVGDKTMSRSALLKYLAGYGMSSEEAADFMEKYNIPG